MSDNIKDYITIFRSIKSPYIGGVDLNVLKAQNVEYYKDTSRLGGRYYYKYYDLEVALNCIQNKELRFVEPSTWIDNYEKMFYLADYSSLTQSSNDTPLLYACCFSNHKYNESAWKLYTYGKTGLGSVCVQFEINRNKLREEIIRATSNVKIYEGKVRYKSESFLKALPSKTSNSQYIITAREQFFNNFSIEKYINLLVG